jgi:Tfp pilus assembly protein PilZ
MGEERRKATRVRDPLFVQYCFDDADGKEIWDITTVQDISETGLSIKTVNAFKIGDPISLRLKVPLRPLEKIEVTGKVVGCSDTGQGRTSLTRIEFSDLPEDTKILFHEYVDWVIKSQSTK